MATTVIKFISNRSDADSLSATVDITDFQVRDFFTACTRGIERHQQDAMKGKLRRVNQTGDFFLAEHLWQTQDLLRIWGLGNTPGSLQHLNIEEP